MSDNEDWKFVQSFHNVGSTTDVLIQLNQPVRQVKKETYLSNKTVSIDYVGKAHKTALLSIRKERSIW